MPDRDYQWGFSHGHEDSIKGVASKDFEVAPVASDILARMVENGEVDPAAVVSIYKSEHFRRRRSAMSTTWLPNCETAIRETLVGFDWKGRASKSKWARRRRKVRARQLQGRLGQHRGIDQVVAEARKASAARTACRVSASGLRRAHYRQVTRLFESVDRRHVSPRGFVEQHGGGGRDIEAIGEAVHRKPHGCDAGCRSRHR